MVGGGHLGFQQCFLQNSLYFGSRWPDFVHILPVAPGPMGARLRLRMRSQQISTWRPAAILDLTFPSQPENMNNFWPSWPIIMKFEMEHPYGQRNSHECPDMVLRKMKDGRQDGRRFSLFCHNFRTVWTIHFKFGTELGLQTRNPTMDSKIINFENIGHLGGHLGFSLFGHNCRTVWTINSQFSTSRGLHLSNLTVGLKIANVENSRWPPRWPPLFVVGQ